MTNNVRSMCRDSFDSSNFLTLEEKGGYDESYYHAYIESFNRKKIIQSVNESLNEIILLTYVLIIQDPHNNVRENIDSFLIFSPINVLCRFIWRHAKFMWRNFPSLVPCLSGCIFNESWDNLIIEFSIGSI